MPTATGVDACRVRRFLDAVTGISSGNITELFCYYDVASKNAGA